MRVLLMGDSMAEGLERPLRALLASQGHTLIPDWHRGDTTGYWTGIARNAIDKANADVVLIALGTNDANNRVPPATTARNAAGIAGKAGGRPLLWLLPPNSPHVNVNATNEAIKSSVPAYVDARSLGLGFYDGIHPTPAGFATWASAIAGRIGSAARSSGTRSKSKSDGNDAMPVILLALLIFLWRF
jgi:lysophospholipase L1-like esterase